jgi:hypothetical protein
MEQGNGWLAVGGGPHEGRVRSVFSGGRRECICTLCFRTSSVTCKYLVDSILPTAVEPLHDNSNSLSFYYHPSEPYSCQNEEDICTGEIGWIRVWGDPTALPHPDLTA